MNKTRGLPNLIAYIIAWKGGLSSLLLVAIGMTIKSLRVGVASIEASLQELHKLMYHHVLYNGELLLYWSTIAIFLFMFFK